MTLPGGGAEALSGLALRVLVRFMYGRGPAKFTGGLCWGTSRHRRPHWLALGARARAPDPVFNRVGFLVFNSSVGHGVPGLKNRADRQSE